MRKTVLVVDDFRDTRKLVKLLLEKNAKGDPNWRFPNIDPDSDWPVIRRLTVLDGTLTYRDPTERTNLIVAANSGKGNGKSGPRPELQFIVELINRVDREEPADRLEAVLKTDPTLAFRLMRYINSPAFGLSVEINSFRHAIMVLGYNRLKRWLALLLASASKDPNVKPVMYAAVRRGLLMEELGRQSASSDQRSEMFICGVFSLLDRLMGQPLAELMHSIPVPDAVRAALVDQSGPYHAQLELVRAVEAESVFDIRSAADATMLGLPEVNRAVLRALSGARQLD